VSVTNAAQRATGGKMTCVIHVFLRRKDRGTSVVEYSTAGCSAAD
jgi:hypothetical protein